MRILNIYLFFSGSFFSLFCRAVDEATQTGGTPLFATEFGLQTLASCPANANCVLNNQQQAAGMQSAIGAIRASGVCPLALWYDYRDDYGVCIFVSKF